MFEALIITQTISVFLGLYLLSFGIELMLERDNMSDMMKKYLGLMSKTTYRAPQAKMKMQL